MAKNRLGIEIAVTDNGSKVVESAASKISAAQNKQNAEAQKAADQFKSNFGFMKTAAAALVTTVAGASVGITGFGIASGASLQTTAAAFRAMIGDASQAKDLFSDLYDFARGTPFAFPDVTSAARTLLGYGRTAIEVKSDIQVLGGMVATTGADWSRLAVVYGQVNAAGKLYAQDALQLIENGVPITTALAKKLGVSIQDVRGKMAEGEITAKIFNEAMREMVPADAIAQMSNTLTGRLSGLTGSIRSVAFSLVGIDYSKFDEGEPLLVQQGGLFDRLTKAVEGFSKTLSDPQIKAAAAKLGAGLASILEGGGNALIGFVKWSANNLPLFKSLLLGVATGFAAFKIAKIATDFHDLTTKVKDFSGLLAAFKLNPVVLAVTALAAGLVFLQSRFDLVGKAIGFVRGTIDAFQAAFERTKQFLKDHFPQSVEAARKALDLLNRGIDFVSKGFKSVGSILVDVGGKFGRFADRQVAKAVQFFEQKMPGATRLTGEAIQAVKTTLDQLDTALARTVQAIGRAAKGPVKALRDAFRGAHDWLKDAHESMGVVADYVKQGFSSAVKKGRDAIGFFVDSSRNVSEWLKDNEGWLKTVAVVASVIFGPALIGAGATAAAAGLRIAASGISAGGGWVTGAISAAAAWVTNTVRMALLSTGLRIGMAKDAVLAGLAWTAGAVKSSVAWLLNLAKISLTSTATGVKVAISAADSGWAWVFNATRASVAWVTTELPKIVAAAAATAIASTRQAVIASTAWVVNAAKSATAWVVTELPKIVAGFFTTSGVSVAQALIASGAWVVSAATAATAWVVTELPRIIGAFVLMAGSSVVNAVAASTAWVSAAITSSAAISSLAALVATPMVMPAIAVAAAIGALISVKNAANDAHTAINDAMAASNREREQSVDMMKSARARYDRGEITMEQMRKIVGAAAKADGGPVSAGQTYAVGDNPDGSWNKTTELFVPSQSGTIISAPKLQALARGGAGATAQANPAQGASNKTTNLYIDKIINNNNADQSRMIRDIGFALEYSS